MKLSNLILAFLITGIFFTSCGQGVTPTGNLQNDVDSASYLLGINYAKGVKQGKFEDINLSTFLQGMQDVLDDKEVEITDQEMRDFLNKFFTKLAEKQHEQNLTEGREFLAENAEKEGIITTESGLQYEIIAEGTGISILATDTVVAHYHGTLINGEVFQSTVERGQPVPFPVNRVIPGWIEGLQLMKEGAKYKFYIPTELAYGQNPPQGSGIEPNMAIIFEVEILELKKGPDHQ